MLDKKPYKRTAHMKVNRRANCRWIYQNLVKVVRYVVLKGFAFPCRDGRRRFNVSNTGS